MESSESHSAAGDSQTSAQGESPTPEKPGRRAVGPRLKGAPQPASPGPFTPTSAPPGEMLTARPSRLPAEPQLLASAVPVPELPGAKLRKPLKERLAPTQKKAPPGACVHMRPPTSAVPFWLDQALVLVAVSQRPSADSVAMVRTCPSASAPPSATLEHRTTTRRPSAESAGRPSRSCRQAPLSEAPLESVQAAREPGGRAPL